MTGDDEIDAPRLSDGKITELLQLLRKVDSVELKVTLPVEAHRATVRRLPIDPVEAAPRQVFFFDTPSLTLDHAGVVVRARRFQGGRADTVVKLRPVDPDQLPAGLRRSGAYTVEVDVLPGGFVCSGSLKGRATSQEISDAVAGKVALRKILSREQRAYYAAHAPEGVGLDHLSTLGPIFVLKSVFAADTTEAGGSAVRRMVAEMWLYPDGSRILELSTKCPPREALQAAAETRTWLVSRGIDIGGAQQTKTRTALTFFAAELSDQASATAQDA
jgi:hypothetical protein